MRQVFLDTETTGANIKQGHRIIEIGCIETIDLKKTKRTFPLDGNVMILDPQRDIEEGATRVHGITREMTIGKTKFSEIVDDFLNFIDGAELVIHNAPFDIGFLNYELELCGRGKISNQVADSLLIVRKKYPGEQASLDALCRKMGIDNSKRLLHGALLDADLLADVFIKMFENEAVFGDFANWGKVIHEESSREKHNFPKRSFNLTQEELNQHINFLKSIGV